MDRWLPSETIQRPDYRRIRQLYGLMNTTYRLTDASEDPKVQYKELQSLVRDLRRRLNELNAAKGIPAKMTRYLDELKNAIDDALTQGVTMNFIMQGVTDLLTDKPNAQPENQPEVAKMIPDTKYKKARAELIEARKKIQKLNEENNALTLRVKRLEMERGGSCAH